MLLRSAKALLGGHPGAAGRAGAALGPGLAGSRGFAVEKGPQQTDMPTPKKPFVQEDTQGTKQQQKEAYESMVAQASGVAEDVRVKDQEGTTLGKMARDQRGPENERVKGARDLAASSEREMEDQGLADVVFDDKADSSTQDVMESTSEMVKPSGTATKPQ